MALIAPDGREKAGIEARINPGEFYVSTSSEDGEGAVFSL
jgi:hypothetical protein